MTEYEQHTSGDDAPEPTGPTGPAYPVPPIDLAGGSAAPDTGAGESAATDRSFPWPPAEGEGIVEAWGRTWNGASLHPRSFFSALPRAAPLGPAILYYLSIGIPVAGAQLFWTLIRGSEAAGPAGEMLGALEPWAPLIDFLVSPLYLLVSLVLAAAVTHLLLKLFSGGDGGYGVTARVFAYAYSPQILGIVPVIGAMAGFIWMVVVAIVGLREAHRTTTVRAAFAVLIPLAIAAVFVALVALIEGAGLLLESM